MPKGGYRPNAGRPRKALGEPQVDSGLSIEEEAEALGLTPLEYMIKVMNDGGADPLRRDRMAIAAAPYLHPKAGEQTGKKAEREARAKTAQNGTEWEDLLSGPKLQ
jgi:hypothetical protein